MHLSFIIYKSKTVINESTEVPNARLCSVPQKETRALCSGVGRISEKGGAEVYAREIFDNAPSLTVKVEVHDVVPCAF